MSDIDIREDLESLSDDAEKIEQRDGGNSPMNFT